MTVVTEDDRGGQAVPRKAMGGARRREAARRMRRMQDEEPTWSLIGRRFHSPVRGGKRQKGGAALPGRQRGPRAAEAKWRLGLGLGADFGDRIKDGSEAVRAKDE